MQNQQKYLKSVGLAAEFSEKGGSYKGEKWEHDCVKLSLLWEVDWESCKNWA